MSKRKNPRRTKERVGLMPKQEKKKEKRDRSLTFLNDWVLNGVNKNDRWLNEEFSFVHLATKNNLTVAPIGKALDSLEILRIDDPTVLGTFPCPIGKEAT